MKDKEEHALIEAVRDAGLPDVADKMEAVLDKRETQLEYIIEKQTDACSKLDKLMDGMDYHTKEEMERWDQVVGAFPHGDIDGHHDYHYDKIQAAKAQEEFWNELKLDLIKKGTWAVTIIVIGLIVTGISVKMGLK